MALPEAAVQAYLDRASGNAPNGEVGIRDFDLGLCLTLGGVLHRVGPDEIPGYYATVPGVEPAPGLPGVQLVFGNPDDAFVNYLLPLIVLTRDDITPAMARAHPYSVKYRAPKSGAQQIQVVGPGGVIRTGYRDMVQQEIPTPYDISYTLTIAHQRRGLKARESGLKLLNYVIRRCPPFFLVGVLDSIGDTRLYFATAEASTTADELADVADRLISWTMGVTVEAHLDLLDAEDVKMVTGTGFSYKQL